MFDLRKGSVTLLAFIGVAIAQDWTLLDRKTDLTALSNPVKIGNETYKFFEIFGNGLSFFRETTPKSVIFGTYPLKIDLPRISLLNTSLRFENIDMKMTQGAAIKTFEENIRTTDNFNYGTSFNINGGLRCTYGGFNLTFLWSENRTYVALKNISLVFQNLNLFLGKDFEPYAFVKDFPVINGDNFEHIYEISSTRIIRVTCIPVNVTNTEPVKLQLMISKYRLHNLGGENVILQGPCLTESSNQPWKLEIRNPNYPSSTPFSTYIEMNMTTHSFTLRTPFFWYLGIYELKISKNSVEFLTQVEIYQHSKHSLSWMEIDNMNNPSFTLPFIYIFSPIEDNVKLNLRIIDVKNSNEGSIIFKEQDLPVENRIQLKLIKLADINVTDINIYEHIGVFFLQHKTQETMWSQYFSLIWLKMKLLQNNVEFNDSQCLKYILRPVGKQYYCPDNLDRAKGLLSMYRKMDIAVDLKPYEMESYKCYSTALPGKDTTNGFRGTTCCYDNSTSHLVYGQQFYNRNVNFLGSYIWSHSPFINPLVHFINDRIPIYSCCVIISNPELCSRYWSEQHPIKLSLDDPDLRGNVFGDPHFIPFKAEFPYTFLGLGQYNLIVSKNENFMLQGRFYSEVPGASFLKMVAFKLLDAKIFITIGSEWKISFTNFASKIPLPFNNNTLHIFPSADLQKLYVYARIEDNVLIHLVIQRFPYNKKTLEYMNMEIHLSGTSLNYGIDGLFGRADDFYNSSLFHRNMTDQVTSESLANYRKIIDFVLSWKILPTDINLFADPDSVNFTVYGEPKVQNVVNCEDNKMCNIDGNNYYEQDNIHFTTLNAVKYRKNLDEEWTSFQSKKSVCDYPSWKYIKLNSTNFEISESVKVTGCIPPYVKNYSSDLVLTCVKNVSGALEWKANLEIKDFCVKKNVDPGHNESKNDNTVTLAASVGAGVIILLCFLLLILCFVIRRRRRSVYVKNDENNTKNDFQMDAVYENNLQNYAVDSSDYATYAEIRKQVK